MTLAVDPPKERFRLSQLVYDTRYRSYTIQVIVLMLVIALLIWLTLNTAANLAAKDKDINFRFLFSRAGYDIGQQLIPYTNDSTHGRALFVGLFNTLIVAALGCVFATIIGVVAGVLRLSNNWLVARLMTIYVEVFRNVPLLLWIILVYTVFSEALPQPKDFRPAAVVGADGVAVPGEVSSVVIAMTNRGTNIPAPQLTHSLGSVDILGVPFNIAGWLAIFILAGSIWVNSMLRARAKAVQEETGIRPTTWWKSILILVLPVVLFLAALGFHLDYPALKGFNFAGGILVAHSFTALLIALSLYTGSYIAEAVRAGILAINKGQTEAAFALGIRPGRTMSLIVLPQALRVIVPPLISQYLNLTKNTTLGMAISYLDLKGTLGGITLNQTGRELECMLLMMVIYLALSLLISAVMNAFNTSVKLKER
jgi:general L-amino acid transport system permease protein